MRNVHPMIRLSKSRLVAVSKLLAPVALFSMLILSAQPVLAQQVDFSKEILPVLKANCFKCHGEKIRHILPGRSGCLFQSLRAWTAVDSMHGISYEYFR